MLVVEKTRHINVSLTGEGAATVAALLKKSLPDAVLVDDESEAVEWKTSALAKEIKAAKTPGRLVRAYRERAGRHSSNSPMPLERSIQISPQSRTIGA